MSTPLDPDNKSGHYVSDPPGPCWCDQVHHYARSEGLTHDEVANYPLVCRQAFLDATRKGHVAQKHVIDAILDDYNLWLSCFGD